MADDGSIQGIQLSWFYAYTIGIIIGSILITLIFTGLAYLILRCLKKRQFEPEYYIDEASIQKDPPEYDKENFHVVIQEPQSIQIQPILTISEVVSSVKQSLQDLGDAITPKRWSHAPPMVNEKPPVEEKTDLAI